MNIPGATEKTYTIPSVVRGDAGTYQAVVSSPTGKSVTSAAVTATVTPDTTAPTILSAQRSFRSAGKVIVVFSEPVSSATAETAANYKINGLTVNAATLTSNPRIVQLTTSPVPDGSTNRLEVSGVQDRFGNAIAGNTSVGVGQQKNIFFVTADPGPLTFAGDVAVDEHLVNRGFDVTLARGSDVPDDGSTAQGSDLIIHSFSAPPGCQMAQVPAQEDVQAI